MVYAFLAACRRYPPFSADQKRTKAEQNRELQDKIMKGCMRACTRVRECACTCAVCAARQYRFYKTYWDPISDAAKEVVSGLLTVRTSARPSGGADPSAPAPTAPRT